MKKHLYIYALFLAILSGCSSVETAKPIKIIAANPEKEVFWTNHVPYKKAIDCANKVIKETEFKSRVLAANFEQTTDTSWQVLQKIEQAKPTQVKPIWPKNRWSAMTATTFKNDPAIYLNARKSRPLPDMVGSVCHELTHKLGYTHRGNSPRGNERTVPYALGSICEELARKHCL